MTPNESEEINRKLRGCNFNHLRDSIPEGEFKRQIFGK